MMQKDREPKLRRERFSDGAPMAQIFCAVITGALKEKAMAQELRHCALFHGAAMAQCHRFSPTGAYAPWRNERNHFYAEERND
jgi:hypothetical protein